MDWIGWSPYIVTGLTTVILPPVGYLVKTVVRNNSRLAKHEALLEQHEATDTLQFQNIQTTLDDLKEGQRDQSRKLDRIVDHLLG
jgi:hypothetical protein